MNILKHEGKLYEQFEKPGIFKGYVESSIPEGVPTLQYLGPRIGMELFAPVMAFFEWAFSEHHCEAQVRLFMNQSTGAWKAWAFPQLRGGMTTKEFDCQEKDRQRADLGSVGERGTIHSHGSMSAFQSSTDTSDESQREGIHITIGGIGKARYDIHARVLAIWNGRKCFYPASLSQWIDLPGLCGIDDDIRDIVASRKISLPPVSTVKFPDVWRTNLMAPPVSVPVRPNMEWQADWQPSNHRFLGEKEHIDNFLSEVKVLLGPSGMVVSDVADLLDSFARNLGHLPRPRMTEIVSEWIDEADKQLDQQVQSYES